MMQLLCNGVRLDLYENAEIQFTHDNPLFAFDKLSCERTTQFKLPSTPTNDSVLSLARIPAYTGTGMRRRFTAQLQAGVVVKDGYLYISSYDGTDYIAVFVTGELVGLQAIKDYGKLADIMDFADVVEIGDSIQTPSAASGTLWANVQYKHEGAGSVFPSIGLQQLYEEIVAEKGITAQAFPSSLSGVRIVPVAAAGVDEKQTFITTQDTSSTQPTAEVPTDPYNTLTYDSRLFEYEDTICEYMQMNVSKYYLIRQFKCKTALKITLPSTFPANEYILAMTDYMSVPSASDFYGDRYFTRAYNESVVRYGEPLAGRTIEFEEGDVFCFVNENCYVADSESVLGTTYYTLGFDFSLEPTFDSEYECEVQSVNDPLEDGDLCRLQDNLPDITFIELCKTIAALCGCVLNYDDTNGLTFDELDFSTWSIQDISKLTKRGEVMRTFAGYAQENLVQFNSNDIVRNRLVVTYTIDNDNIEEENDLLTMPFSEGTELDNMIYIESDLDEQTIADSSEDYDYLVRVSLSQNEGLQALCTASTQIKISAHMGIAEYNAITAKTLLRVDNTLYAWTARTWKKDIAQFTLAKV